MNIQESLAKNTRYYRRRLKISQEELAQRCGLARAQVGLIENGRNITIGTLERLAEGLNVAPPRLLVTFEENGKPQLDYPVKKVYIGDYFLEEETDEEDAGAKNISRKEGANKNGAGEGGTIRESGERDGVASDGNANDTYTSDNDARNMGARSMEASSMGAHNSTASDNATNDSTASDGSTSDNNTNDNSALGNSGRDGNKDSATKGGVTKDSATDLKNCALVYWGDGGLEFQEMSVESSTPSVKILSILAQTTSSDHELFERYRAVWPQVMSLLKIEPECEWR